MDQTNDNARFVIEGKLTHLHWELGSENLLAKVDKHYKRNAALSGAGAAVGDMFGQVANSAMLAMYDGEDTQNFMCLIDDQPACGQFGGAEHLPEGGNIKAVVSRKEGVLYVHAALDTERELIWINHPFGIRAEMWANIKLGWYLFLFAMVFLSIVIFLIGPKNNNYLDTFIEVLIYGGGFMTVMTLWSFSGLKAIAGPSTECFRMLGLADPEGVNLNNHIYFYEVLRDYRARGEEPPDSWYNASPFQYRNVYSLRAAIKSGKVKLVSPKYEANVTTAD